MKHDMNSFTARVPQLTRNHLALAKVKYQKSPMTEKALSLKTGVLAFWTNVSGTNVFLALSKMQVNVCT